MSGTSRSYLPPGAPCWALVNDVNSPTGMWRAEVVSCEVPWEPHEGEAPTYYRTTVKLTDDRLKHGHEFSAFYNTAPHVNYDIIPLNPDTSMMVGRIDYLKEEVQRVQEKAALRERALLDALKAVSGGSDKSAFLSTLVGKQVTAYTSSQTVHGTVVGTMSDSLVVKDELGALRVCFLDNCTVT